MNQPSLFAQAPAPPKCSRCNGSGQETMGTGSEAWKTECVWCEGTGVHYEGCKTCNEWGTRRRQVGYGPTRQIIEEECPDCNGLGVFDHNGKPYDLFKRRKQ